MQQLVPPTVGWIGKGTGLETMLVPFGEQTQNTTNIVPESLSYNFNLLDSPVYRLLTGTHFILRFLRTKLSTTNLVISKPNSAVNVSAGQTYVQE